MNNNSIIKNYLHIFKNGNTPIKLKIIGGLFFLILAICDSISIIIYILNALSSDISKAGIAGAFAGCIISSCMVAIYIIIGLFLLKSAKRNITETLGKEDKKSNHTAKKSILAIIYPWLVLTLPFLFITAMHSSTGAPGYFFIYYMGLHVPIVLPLAIISTVSKNRKVYITCNIIATLGSIPIIFLGFIFSK